MSNHRKPTSLSILDDRGTSSVEFVVLLTCIAVAAIAAWQVMGRTIVSIISGD